MNKFLTVLLLMVATISFGQKIKLKKGEVLVDEVVWLKYDGCGAFDSTCSLLNIKGEELIFIKTITVSGVEPVTNYNKTGDLNYNEVKFLGLNDFAEFKGYTQKRLLEALYKGKVINENGELDEDMVQRFIEKYGKTVSANLNGTPATNTIIIQEAPRPRNGININLGR